jgi:NAD-dependent oxidoreductase involved in siderophore biosynthesis
MSGTTSLEIVMAVVFLLALLLPVILGTDVSPPRSALDVISGFSKFNRSLYKLLVAPGVGLGLVVVVYSDTSVPRLYSFVVFVVAASLDIAALTLGARRGGWHPSVPSIDSQDDGLDYASRLKRLEDQIESESVPPPNS